MASEILMGCPFCGAQPIIVQRPSFTVIRCGTMNVTVNMDDSGKIASTTKMRPDCPTTSIEVYGDTRDVAIKRWNIRDLDSARVEISSIDSFD